MAVLEIFETCHSSFAGYGYGYGFTVLRLDGRGGERFSFHSSWKLVERAHAVEFSRLPP